MINKTSILYESCLEAGYSCAEQSFSNVFSNWKEDRNLDLLDDSIPELVRKCGGWLGFPTEDDVIVNFADQSGEDLYGDSQADAIWIDESVFPEFNGRNHWEILEKYLEGNVVDMVNKAYDESLNKFLSTVYPKEKSPISPRLVFRSENFLLDIPFSSTINKIDDLSVDSFGDALEEELCEFVKEFVQPAALDKVCSPRGKLDGDELGNELTDAAIDIFSSETEGKIFILRDGYEDEPIPNEWLLEWMRDYYWDSSTLCPFTGEGIIRCVADFLTKGAWHIDLDDKKNPFLWFGIDQPIDIWSLPFISDNENTSWKSIWFPDFWDLDWNAILGKSGEPFIVWMFCEMCMDEPVQERDRVRDNCPIILSEDDTLKSIIEKIKVFARTSEGDCLLRDVRT